MFRNRLRNQQRKLTAWVGRSPVMAYRWGRRQFGLAVPAHLYYVVPSANWVTDWVGHYITSEIWQQFQWPAQVTITPKLLQGHILHFSEMGTFMAAAAANYQQHNQIIATIFHGSRDQQYQPALLVEKVERFLLAAEKADRVMTACRLMETRLVKWGLAPEKVICIPLGVDLHSFRPPLPGERQAQRRQLGIPEDAFCIGSFQKDGEGWGEGLQPKYIKGPDLFLDVVNEVYRRHPKLHVLLTGPARGYVKQGLEKIGVSYHHRVLANFQDIVAMYHALDGYLIASREEGGPKGVLESLATGVPLVSTRVGLAPDVITHNQDGLLANIEDVSMLSTHLSTLISDVKERERLSTNGLNTIRSYDWPHIAAAYYHQIYRSLRATQEGESN